MTSTDHSSNIVIENASNPSANRISSLALIPLWASAFVLAALVILQSGRLSPTNAARGEMTAVGSEFSMLTTDSGNGEFLTILNSRDGNMYVYEVTSANGVALVDRLQIAEIMKRFVKTGDK